MLSLVMALDSFLLQLSSPGSSSIVVRDADRLHDSFRLRPGQIDRQQPVLEIGTQHFHAIREHEGALELARRYAAMKIVPGLFLLLSPTDQELALLNRHVELITREPGDRERNAQALRSAVLASDPFDVVGRVAVGRLGNAIERSLDLVEPKKEGTGQRRNSGHGFKAL